MKKQGFTIVELLIVSLISVIVVGGVTTSLAHVLRTWRESEVSAELNMNLEVAMEHMRHDMRLSSVGLGLMSFYPIHSRRYTAISFPMAEDSNDDGLLDRDEEGRIVWAKTVIYHVLGSTPNEFRRTIFDNRNSGASPEQLYSQLSAVAKATSSEAISAAAMEGEACTSRTLFRNLTHLSFYPPSNEFDGYAETRKRGTTFNFGSIVLRPGTHWLKFNVVGRNSESSGYNVEIDRLRIGRSRGSMEAEIFFPNNTHPVNPLFQSSASGGGVVVEDMSAFGTEWSGNAQAKLEASGANSWIGFSVDNDMWSDSNFNEPGATIAENCSVKWDTSFEAMAPYIGDRVVSMDKGVAWSAAACGDSAYVLPVSNVVKVSSIIYGSDARDDMSIALNGRWAKFRFERPTGYSLNLSDVTVADVSSGGSAAVTFNNGNSSVTVPETGASFVESDWVQMWETDRTKSYAVSFTSTPQDAGPWGLAGWLNNDGVTLSVIDGTPSSFTAGLHSFDVGFPEEAIYRSGIYDTRTEAPRFTRMYWTERDLSGAAGDVDIRIRSSDSKDMSSASWTAANPGGDGYFESNIGSSISGLPAKRYVQYEARLTCGEGGNIGAHTNSTSVALRDVAIEWWPPVGLVDLEVDFGMGPDCGIVEATINGKEFARSMVVELAIFKDGPRGQLFAREKIEIRPLNTGK
jgi:type II secretory pathway pseudopilin PulG